MKKSWPVIVVVVVVVAGVGIYFGTKSGRHTSKPSGSTNAPVSYSFKKACDILTLPKAQSLLGSSVSGGPTAANAATADIDVSTCAYIQELPAGASAGALKSAESASLLVRGAKTATGADSNDGQFKAPRKPAEAQDVSGYGDAAYWDPRVGQFNILKHHNWYILSYGPAQVSQHTLDHTKKLADAIKSQL
jgi:hypothetical protein